MGTAPTEAIQTVDALSDARREGQASNTADPLQRTKVAEAMLTTPRLVAESSPIAYARRLLEERGAALMVVDDQGRLVGIVTRSDLRGRHDVERGREVRVGDIAVRNLVTARPDETLRTAVRRMNRLGLRQLPVVGNEPPAPPLGLLRRSDVLAVYGSPEDTEPRPAQARTGSEEEA